MQILTSEAKQKLVGYRDEFLTVYPNSDMIDNPDYDDQLPISESNLLHINKYTDSQWLDIVVKRWLLRQLQVGDKKIKHAAVVNKDFNME